MALVAFGVAALALAAFLVVEFREDSPMLPVRLFARAEFGLINLASFAMGFGTFATFFLLSLYPQSVRGAAPTEGGGAGCAGRRRAASGSTGRRHGHRRPCC